MRNIFITRSGNDNISVYELEPVVVVTLNRDDLPKLKDEDSANNPGVYILLGDNKRYVGQTGSRTINIRLAEHNRNADETWFNKIYYFGRADGALTPTHALYLERKFIAYFRDNGLPITNKNAGNNGKIDRLSKIKADELWTLFLEVLDKVANIDLLEDARDSSSDIGQLDRHLHSHEDKHSPRITFADTTITGASASEAWVNFAKSLLQDPRYGNLLREYIVNDEPNGVTPLGTQQRVFASGRVATTELEPGIHLYVHLSKDGIKKAINRLAGWLELSATTNF